MSNYDLSINFNEAVKWSGQSIPFTIRGEKVDVSFVCDTADDDYEEDEEMDISFRYNGVLYETEIFRDQVTHDIEICPHCNDFRMVARDSKCYSEFCHYKQLKEYAGQVCGICNQPIDACVAVTRKCKHVFHKNCIMKQGNPDSDPTMVPEVTCQICNKRTHIDTHQGLDLDLGSYYHQE